MPRILKVHFRERTLTAFSINSLSFQAYVDTFIRTYIHSYMLTLKVFIYFIQIFSLIFTTTLNRWKIYIKLLHTYIWMSIQIHQHHLLLSAAQPLGEEEGCRCLALSAFLWFTARATFLIQFKCGVCEKNLDSAMTACRRTFTEPSEQQSNTLRMYSIRPSTNTYTTIWYHHQQYITTTNSSNKQ